MSPDLHSKMVNQPLKTEILPDILERIYNEVIEHYGKGKVADYIPDLKKVDPNQFGMALRTVEGEEFTIGEGLC